MTNFKPKLKRRDGRGKVHIPVTHNLLSKATMTKCGIKGDRSVREQWQFAYSEAKLNCKNCIRNKHEH